MATRKPAFWPWAMGLCAITACSSVAAQTMRKDTLAELDKLSQATVGVVPGLATARRQIASGELLGALATLERVLIHHPDAGEVLLLHASLLCRLDDRSGSEVEFDYLRGRGVPDQQWNEATAPCSPNWKPGT
ncbi:MAG: hypothetical protein ABIM50_15345 [Novosphingobium sp.]